MNLIKIVSKNFIAIYRNQNGTPVGVPFWFL